MDEREEFLRAIREEPDDDVHRLVFADWLEDQGEADWAALIRHQCGLARLTEPSADPFAETGLVDILSLRSEVRRPLLGAFEPLPTCFVERGSLYHNPCSLLVRRGLPEILRLAGDEAVNAVLGAVEGARGNWGRPVRCVSLGHSFSGITEGVLARFFRSRFLSNFADIDLRKIAFYHGRPVPLPRRWPAGTRLWVNGRQIGRPSDLRRLQNRVGSGLVVDPAHPGDRFLDDDIPF